MAESPDLMEAINDSFNAIAGKMFQSYVERYNEKGARKEFNDNLKRLCASYKDARSDIQGTFKELAPAEPPKTTSA
jgi:hypothetical protein